MLTSLVLQLKSPGGAELPASLGRAVQALLLRLIEQRDEALARELHDSDGPKPLTASNLMLGKRQRGTLYIQAGQEGWLRLTGLSAPVSQVLAQVAAEPPRTVEIDRHPLTVTGATVDPEQHRWAGQISYQDLAAPYLLGGQERPGYRVRLAARAATRIRPSGRTCSDERRMRSARTGPAGSPRCPRLRN